jgi:hypothetical protein
MRATEPSEPAAGIEPANDTALSERDFEIRIRPGELAGYGVWCNGVFVGGHSSAAEMAAWLEEQLRPLDPAPAEPERLPAMLQSAGRDSRRTVPGRIVRLLRGGRS